MLFDDRTKGRGWGKRGDSKQAIARACVEVLEDRRLLAACGQEFVVASSGNAEQPTVAMMPGGGSVVGWSVREGSANNLRMQRYDAAGSPVGSSFVVSSTLLSSGKSIEGVDVAVGGNGEFVVTWGTWGFPGKIYARRFNAAGAARGAAFLVDGGGSDVFETSSSPAVAMAADGRFAIVYNRRDIDDDQGVFLRAYDAEGAEIGDEVRISPYVESGLARPLPSVAMAANGQVVVGWVSSSASTQGYDVFARMLRATEQGLVLGDVLQPNVTRTNNQIRPTPVVAMDASGNWAVAWQSSSSGIVMRRYDARGQALDSDERRVVGGETASQLQPDIAMAPDGRFALTWVSDVFGSAALYGRRYDAAGEAMGAEFLLDEAADCLMGDTAVLALNCPKVAVGSHGELLTVWHTGSPSTGSIVAVRYAGGLEPNCGGPYTSMEGGQATLAGDAQWSPDHPVTQYEWDLDYNGQSFDVDATGKTPVFSAATLIRGDHVTIGLRVRDGDDTVSAIATSTVSVTPGATFASGGNVTMGSGGTVGFSNVRASAADLAGMRYFYDFNNDGVFEVRKSTSPTCQVPASYLATPGKHTVRARIKDSGGLYTDFTADIPVNVPADYSPFVAGLKWRSSGQEDGVSYTETDSIVADTYNGQSVFRCHSDERKSGSTEHGDDYVRWNGTGFDLLGAWSPASSADDNAFSLLLGRPMPYWSETLAAGQSLAWSNIPMTLAYTDFPSTIEPLRQSGQMSGSIQFVRFEDVTLGNGLHFKNALVVQQSVTMTVTYTYRGVRITSDSSVTDTAWFVRGLGCIKGEESGSTRTYASNGYDKTENSTDRSELSSLPAWANYLSFAGDVLQVNGTDRADTITFEVSGANLTCYRNGVPQSVPLASVHGVVINALGGNDVVDARALWVPVTMTGGGGRDSLVGGQAGDVISGGGGADTLLGGGGADAIRAGSGNDSVLGQGGEDSLNGGAGNDTLDGGAGEDTLVDASGASVLRGGAGADYIDARNGWTGDVIDGGSEADTVLTDVREGALNAEYCYAKTPKVPGGLAADAGVGEAGGVTASWSSAKWAQSYRIERSLDGSAFELLATVPGSVLSYADSSVLGGVTYYYRISAINPIGVSAYGAGTSVTAG